MGELRSLIHRRAPPRSGDIGIPVVSDAVVEWLLTTDERGNDATAIDVEHEEGWAWTVGNRVIVHVDGAAYFTRLYQLLSGLGAGDWVYLTDWRIDATRRLAGPGTELGPLLVQLARHGVAIRGLLGRSHASLVRFNQDANRVLSTMVNRLSRGRADGPDHRGDPDPVRIDPRYGRRPPWHDLQLEVHGPAVLDVDFTFRERWEDHTPADHRNPLRTMWRRVSHEPRRRALLRRLPPPPVGSQVVQVLRTYPARHRAIPFAPEGERSIARAYLKALRRAQTLVYIEDQYLWGTLVSDALAAALRASAELRMIIVVPRYPDRDGGSPAGRRGPPSGGPSAT
jgi:hypothetical protein